MRKLHFNVASRNEAAPATDTVRGTLEPRVSRRLKPAIREGTCFVEAPDCVGTGFGFRLGEAHDLRRFLTNDGVHKTPEML